jgi:hypothetical protein
MKTDFSSEMQDFSQNLFFGVLVEGLGFRVWGFGLFLLEFRVWRKIRVFSRKNRYGYLYGYGHSDYLLLHILLS